MPKFTPTRILRASHASDADFAQPAAISVDGGRIIVNQTEKTNLRVLRLDSGHTECTLRKDRSVSVRAICLTKDGTRAIGLLYGHYIYVWDSTVGGILKYLDVGHADSMSVTPDGRFAALSGGGPFRLIDLKSETSENSDVALGFRPVAVRSDGKMAVGISPSGNLAKWIHPSQTWTFSKFGSSPATSALVLSPDGDTAIAVGEDFTLRVWNTASMLRSALLEGHTDKITTVAITPNGEFAISGSEHGHVIIWDLTIGHRIITIKDRHLSRILSIGIGSDGNSIVTFDASGLICTWDLRNLRYDRSKRTSDRTYRNAKVLVVGNTGVGKTALTHRLCTGNKPAKTKSSDAVWATHLALPHKPTPDKEEREIWLWDFAGQQDYRVIHQLYTDEASLAVFVFNPQDRNPFDGLHEWDRDLFNATHRPFAKLLVAGRCDVGRLLVSRHSIDEFCSDNGFAEYIETSAETGEGCETLRDAIVSAIKWDSIPYTSSPQVFQRIKQGILQIKDGLTNANVAPHDTKVLYTVEELELAIRGLVRQKTPFSEYELGAVLALLHSPGIVWRLAFGDYVLLQPEKVNQYASAVIRTIRLRADGLGYIAEDQITTAEGLDFGSMHRLTSSEEIHVMRAMHHLLLSRGLCIREASLKKEPAVLIFPSLFRIEKPKPELTIPLVSFVFSGHLDEIYATLIVRLHHTDLVTKKNLWLDAADFETSTGKNIGIKLSRHRFGKAELSIYSDADVDDDIRLPFSLYVYDHIREKDPLVERIRHYICAKCQFPVRDNQVVIAAKRLGLEAIVCSLCSAPIQMIDALERKFASQVVVDKVRELRDMVQDKLDTESKERILVGEMTALVARSGHIFRETPNQDHGIDGEIEFKYRNGRATGERLYVQLKSGDSHLHQNKDEQEIFYADERHAQYWLSNRYDVMLVVRTSDDNIRWMNLTEALKQTPSLASTSRDVSRKIVFAADELTVDALRNLASKILRGRSG